MYVLSSFSFKCSEGMYCEQICDTSSLENSDLRRDIFSPLVFCSMLLLILFNVFVNEHFILCEVLVCSVHCSLVNVFESCVISNDNLTHCLCIPMP